MKRSLLSLLILMVAGVSFAYAQGTQLCYTSNGTNCIPGIQGGKSVAITTASAETVELVPLVALKGIYISAWHLASAGSTTVTFKYGTGTLCGTGTVNLTGAYSLATNTVIGQGSGLGVIFNVPPGNSFCVTNSAGVQISGSATYTQF